MTRVTRAMSQALWHWGISEFVTSTGGVTVVVLLLQVVVTFSPRMLLIRVALSLTFITTLIEPEWLKLIV